MFFFQSASKNLLQKRNSKIDVKKKVLPVTSTDPVTGILTTLGSWRFGGRGAPCAPLPPMPGMRFLLILFLKNSVL
jgi:hypothetical protein